ncbi:UNVERIFIED_CONTAM: hypothetical protein GTU68_051663 [Idotea baltica]|nr:hypothetical protein [Idotea baltica]
MFDNIAHRYDFLNHLLSMGIDKWWRRQVIQILKKENARQILDVATGTADLAIAISKIDQSKIVGIDISKEMIAMGKQKVAKLDLAKTIQLQIDDAENLSFEDNSFDACTVAFGVRNFADLRKGLSEILRILKPGGILIVLEFSKPTIFPVKQVFGFYFKYLLPTIGKWFSKDAKAYTYLHDSVQVFPEGKNFVQFLDETGFNKTKCRRLSFGISSIYCGKK